MSHACDVCAHLSSPFFCFASKELHFMCAIFRYRATFDRKGPGARDGPALLDQVATIKKALPDLTIVSNGNIITYNDVVQNLKLTNADGIMSAEGILDNPALFLPRYYHDCDAHAGKNGISKTHVQIRVPYSYMAESKGENQSIASLTESRGMLCGANLERHLETRDERTNVRRWSLTDDSESRRRAGKEIDSKKMKELEDGIPHSAANVCMGVCRIDSLTC